MDTFVPLLCRMKIRPGRPALLVGFLLLYAALLSGIGLSMWREGMELGLSGARLGRRIFAVLSLLETALVTVLAPSLPLDASGTAGWRGLLAMLAPSSVRSSTMVLGQLVYPALAMMAVTAAGLLPVWGVQGLLGGVTTPEVLATHALLLACAIGMTALGGLCSWLFRDLYTAAGVTYLLVISLAGSVILAGPLITSLTHAAWLVQAVLLVNPFVGAAAAGGLDILRTEWLYVHSPIGQRQFTYPAWYAVGGWYVLLALLLVAASVWRVAYLRCHADAWQASCQA